MKQQAVIGGVLLALGVTLLIIGFSSADSIVDQTKEFFTGRFTESTTWFILGGIVSTTAGGLMLILPRRAKA